MYLRNIEEIEGVQVESISTFQDRRGTTTVHRSKNPGQVMFQTQLFSQNTISGTVRGLHYQVSPHLEVKYIWCEMGSFFDVIFDLRVDSNTFGNWSSINLHKDCGKALIIPSGCAHGYQTLSNDTTVGYLISGEHSESSSRTINPFDSDLGISWPLTVSQVSDRDKLGLSMNQAISEVRMLA